MNQVFAYVKSDSNKQKQGINGSLLQQQLIKLIRLYKYKQTLQNIERLKFKYKMKARNSLNQSVQINEDEVIKFYQQRQKSRRRITSYNTSQIKQPIYDNQKLFNSKSLYRRKGLLNRLQQESGLFNSFNTSIQSSRFLQVDSAHNAERKTSDAQKNLENVDSLDNYDLSHKIYQDKQNHTLDIQCSDTYFPQEKYATKNRSNSLQTQRTSILKNTIKRPRATIPLSTILRQYQQEVKKLQSQNLIVIKEEPKQINKDVVSHYYRPIHNTRWKQSQTQKIQPKDHLEQVRALSGFDKQNMINQKNTEENTPIVNIENKSYELSLFEKQIKQQEQHIKMIQKQNNQYKKFIKSIQKMKRTLEESQKNITDAETRQTEHNLKQLWRWIKNLPNQTFHVNEKKQKKSIR